MSTRAIRATVFSMSLAAFLAVVTKSQSQDLLLYEPFDYPNGEALNVQADWNGSAPLDGLQILNDDSEGDDGTSSLQYFNLPGQGGRVKSTQGSNGDAEILLPSAIIGEESVLYVSFLYKPIEVGNSYFAHNITSGSIQGQLGRWDSKSDNAPTTTFVARWRDGGTRVFEEEPDGHESGETVFVVAKTTLVPGVDNDTFDLWIDPDPGRPEPAPSASTSSLAGAGNDINPGSGILGFSLRVSNSTGQFEFDELRLGTTWESVTSDLVAARRIDDSWNGAHETRCTIRRA